MCEGIEAAEGDVILCLSGLGRLRLNGDDVEFSGLERFKDSPKGQRDVCPLAESRRE
jgi:hypothetical protein